MTLVSPFINIILDMKFQQLNSGGNTHLSHTSFDSGKFYFLIFVLFVCFLKQMLTSYGFKSTRWVHSVDACYIWPRSNYQKKQAFYSLLFQVACLDLEYQNFHFLICSSQYDAFNVSKSVLTQRSLLCYDYRLQGL